MNEVRRGYLDVPFGQVHYRTAGNAGPVVVLLHDSPLSGFVYEDALPGLGAFARAYAIDTPGYGQSSPPPRPQEIAEYGAMVLEVCRAIDAERVVLVGTHTGASIATEAARQGGDRVAGLVLNGLPAYDEPTRLAKLASHAPDMQLQVDGSHLVELWDKYVQQAPAQSLELRQRSVAEVLQVWDRYNWAYNAAFRYQPVVALAEISAPIMSMAAEGDTLARWTRAAAEQFGFPYHEIPGIYGRVPALATDQFVALLRGFLTDVGLLPADPE